MPRKINSPCKQPTTLANSSAINPENLVAAEKNQSLILHQDEESPSNGHCVQAPEDLTHVPSVFHATELDAASTSAKEGENGQTPALLLTDSAIALTSEADAAAETSLASEVLVPDATPQTAIEIATGEQVGNGHLTEMVVRVAVVVPEPSALQPHLAPLIPPPLHPLPPPASWYQQDLEDAAYTIEEDRLILMSTPKLIKDYKAELAAAPTIQVRNIYRMLLRGLIRINRAHGVVIEEQVSPDEQVPAPTQAVATPARRNGNHRRGGKYKARKNAGQEAAGAQDRPSSTASGTQSGTQAGASG
jgi:hypothetical protein